ncbi:hypothetical protein KHQ88_01365 [Mycoplasmatota bacterium]|nr:hypothetical protein KHQ88_01365 [Mycoplasmatota bacterium]
MKKVSIILLSIMIFFSLSSCKMIYRDYQDDDLEILAEKDFGLDTYHTFKIIDLETAKYLTGESYQNSGVIIGLDNDIYKMIFVPRRVSEKAYILDNVPLFSLEDIYLHLETYIDDPIFLEDYGGLSLSISPYASIKENNQATSFDWQLFFIITTDEDTFYANYDEGQLLIFDTNYQLVNYSF